MLTLLNLEDARKAERARILAQAQGEEEKRVAAMVGPQLFTMGPAAAGEAGFKRITSPSTLRDLNPLMHERMQAVCYFLAVTTPFGKRIIQVITDYVVGEGFKALAEDPNVQIVIDRFWNDPVNNFGENIEAWFKELMVFGELCLPTAVNPVDGFVRVGYIDPQEIESIEFGMLQTGDGQVEISIAVAVQLRARLTEVRGRRLELVRHDETFASPTFGQFVGDAFYDSINKAKAATRGISELFALADWIDVFDQMIFDFADKVRFLNAFVWDYTLKGADEKGAEEFRKKVVKSPPKQGGVQVHNDQVVITAVTPDFKGAEMSESARTVKLYGMGGAGLPAWFFADPVDANRATAQEMQGPTGKMLTNRQNMMKRVVTRLVDYAIDQAIAHGVLSKEVDRTWTL
ncbi:MAG: hypothetical protein HY046_08355, partial [Acidobacteria bacterium]|nr:hypothetical protein [Acidobacteriota bacterium]